QLGREKLKGCPAFVALSDQAREATTQAYLQNLSSKVELHPFVDVAGDKLVFKNPIYEEYYLARYVVEHPAESLSRFVTSERTPSAFLALFLLSLAQDRDLTGYGGAVFYTLRLLAAAERDDYQIDITYDAPSASWLARVEGENL